SSAGLLGRRLTVAVEDLLAAGPHVDDLALGELELRRLAAPPLRPPVDVVGQNELHPDPEPERADPLHPGPVRPVAGLEEDVEVVRTDVRVADAIGLADEAHHALGARMPVEGGRGAGL